MKIFTVVVITALAISFQWYAHSDGLLLTDDSHHYLAGSESFKTFFTFIDNAGHHYLFWPPLFPVVLTLFSNPTTQFIWFNVILTLCIALTSWNIITNVLSDTKIQLLCFAAIMLDVHLVLISTFLWSEMIFMVLMLLFINMFLNRHKNQFEFGLMLTAGILMCLQRNAGLFIVTGISVFTFLQEKNTSRKIYKSAMLFLTLASGLLAWNIYVWFVMPHHHFNFSEELFQHTLFNTTSLAEAFVIVFLPLHFLSIPLAMMAIGAFIYSMSIQLKSHTSLLLLAIVCFVYLFFILLVLLINIGGFPVDVGESDRFISVIIPLLMVLLFSLIELIHNTIRPELKKWFLILIFCWLLYPVTRSIKNAYQWHVLPRTTILVD